MEFLITIFFNPSLITKRLYKALLLRYLQFLKALTTVAASF